MTHKEASTRMAQIWDEMKEAEATHNTTRLRALAREVLQITDERAEEGDFSYV